MHICVIGLGNPWVSDDGAGLEAVRRLQAKFATTTGPARNQNGMEAPTVTFLTLPQAQLELIEIMARCQLVIVIDAVRSNAPPGTLHRQIWRPGRLESRGVERASSHGLGLREILELARAMDRLPEQVIVWGIEIETTRPGQGLSLAVAASLPALVDCLCQELKSYMSYAVEKNRP